MKLCLLLLLIPSFIKIPEPWFISYHYEITLSKSESRSNCSVEEYINLYSDIAKEHERKYNIPWEITIAQGILESDKGNSYVARKYNNHFGIRNGKRYRKYDSIIDGFEDHAKVLLNKRYKDLFGKSIERWAYGLHEKGYAESPDYGQSLLQIIKTMRQRKKVVEVVPPTLPVFKLYKGDTLSNPNFLSPALIEYWEKKGKKPLPSGVLVLPDDHPNLDISYIGNNEYRVELID
jgi:hypothetical protein